MKVKDTISYVAGIEGRVSSAIQSDFVKVKGKNLFGENLAFSKDEGIEYSAAVAATGVRSCAIIRSSVIDKYLSKLRDYSRRSIPFVIHIVCEEAAGAKHPYDLGIPGIISWTSCNAREAGERAIISHRIAEMALCPVLHWFRMENMNDPELPDDTSIMEFLGSADTLIDSSTVAQKLAFGDTRRTVPRYVNTRVPGSFGNRKSWRMEATSVAAMQVFSVDHFEMVIQEALTEFQAITGVAHDVFHVAGKPSATNIILSKGFLPQFDDKLNYKLIHTSLLSPYPAQSIDRLMAKGSLKGVLGSVFDHSHVSKYYPGVSKGYYFRLEEDTVALFANQLEKGGTGTLFIDIPFHVPGVDNPNIQVLLQSYLKEYEELKAFKGDFEIGERTSNKPHPPWVDQDKHNLYSLSRFHNSTGWLSDRDINIAEPFQLFPFIPARSSWRNEVKDVVEIPSIDMASCTGCGDCTAECPFIAMPSTSMTAETLIRFSIEKVNQSSGANIKQIVPQVKNIAKSVSREIYNSDNPAENWKKHLDEGFHIICKQLDWNTEKTKTATEEWSLISTFIKSIPLAVTRTHFEEPEALENGMGQFFFLGINPWSCTGCGICKEVCPEKAISIVKRTEEIVTDHTDAYEVYTRVPETDRDTVNRLLGDQDLNSLGVLYMNRTFYQTMDSPAGKQHYQLRKYLHSILVTHSFTYETRGRSVQERVSSIHKKIKERIESKISGAVSSTDYDAIHKALSENSHSHVGLDELFREKSAKLNRQELETEIGMLHSLGKFEEILNLGRPGTGKANCAIAVSSESLETLLEYPENPFGCPVYFAVNEDPVSEITGLIDGLSVQLLNEVAMLRKADLVSAGKYKAQVHDKKLNELTFTDLTDEEYYLVPTLFWFTDSTPDPARLRDVLNTGWPVKVISLPDASSDPRKDKDLLNSLFALREWVHWQTSGFSPSDYIDKLRDILKLKGPALLYMPVPGTEFDTANEYLEFSGLLNKSRLYPEVWYNPTGAKSFMNGLNIYTNPSPFEDFVKAGENDYPVSWADLAFSLPSWKHHFVQTEIDSSEVTVAAFLNGETSETPIIKTGTGKYSVSEQVLEISGWIRNRYSELKGMATYEPEIMKKNILNDMANTYQEKLTSMKTEFEEKLHKERQNHVEMIREKLKRKLVDLSKKGRK